VRFQKQDLLTSKRSFFSESVRGNRLSTVLGASDIVCPCVILDRGACSYRASEIYAYARAWKVAYSNPIPLAEFVGLDCLPRILQRQGYLCILFAWNRVSPLSLESGAASRIFDLKLHLDIQRMGEHVCLILSGDLLRHSYKPQIRYRRIFCLMEKNTLKHRTEP
jgi:hypothetical protein